MRNYLMRSVLVERRRWFAAALVLAGVTASGVCAGPIKVKQLKGELVVGQEKWEVEARYEARVKEACGPFQLVLFVTDHNRTIVDSDGRPIEVVIPLNEPTSVHGKELRFAGHACLRVFRAPNWNRKHLRLHAAVTYVGDQRPLAEKSTKLKVKD